jgi:hypothetical protein
MCNSQHASTPAHKYASMQVRKQSLPIVYRLSEMYIRESRQKLTSLSSSLSCLPFTFFSYLGLYQTWSSHSHGTYPNITTELAHTHQSRYISLLVVLDPGTLTHKAEPGGSVTSGQGGTRRYKCVKLWDGKAYAAARTMGKEVQAGKDNRQKWTRRCEPARTMDDSRQSEPKCRSVVGM